MAATCRTIIAIFGSLVAVASGLPRAARDIDLSTTRYASPATTRDVNLNTSRDVNLTTAITTNLTAQSSCNDLQSYETSHGGKYTSDMWDKLKATDYLTNFTDHWTWTSDRSIFQEDFVSSWGLTESWRCTLDSGCVKPNCNDLGPQSNSDYSAAMIVIADSMDNLSQIFATIWTSVESTLNWFNSKIAEFSSVFDPDQVASHSVDTLWVRELLLGIGTLVGIVAMLAGPLGWVEGTINVLAVNVVGGGLIPNGLFAVSSLVGAEALSAPNPIDRLADISTPVSNYMNAVVKALQDGQNAFYTRGKWNNTRLVDLFDHGAYSDHLNLQFINQNGNPAQQADSILEKVVTLMAYNVAVRRQRVYIMSYPMTENEFNTHAVAAGNNDARLKHWFNGRGYYFQSVYPDFTWPHFDPRVQNPPGWAELHDKYNIDTHHMIEGAVATFNKGGYNTTVDFDWEAYLAANANLDAAVDNVATTPGLVRIPMCDLDANTPHHDGTLNGFFDMLAAPRAFAGSGKKQQMYGIASFCYCLGQTWSGDHSEKPTKFEDMVAVGDWKSGSGKYADWCSGW